LATAATATNHELTLVQASLRDPAATNLITQTLTVSLLRALLHRLQPELAEHIPAILLRLDQALPVRVAAHDKKIWQWIYQALFVQAVAPSVKNLSRELLRRLARETGQPVFGQWLTLAASATPRFSDTSPPKPQDESVHRKAGAPILSKSIVTPEPLNTPAASLPLEAHMQNGGMVIFAPYMQRLFGLLELSTGSEFVNAQAAERAVHLLQYAVSGEQETPEFQLVLNKLLCGIRGGTPICRGIQIQDHEKQVIEQMLNGVIANWPALGKTSIQGLRQTFLRRPAHLQYQEQAWKLQVQPGTFDMLLDRLPWSFALIKMPWMSEPLHVNWRN
jgi:hypothetical protein